MRTKLTEIHRVQQGSRTAWRSLQAPSEDWLECLRDQDPDQPISFHVERVEVPFVVGEIVLWDSSNDGCYPHLHFECPACGVGGCVDLYADDPNPRFAGCDRCGTDSILWVEWSDTQLQRLKNEDPAFRQDQHGDPS